MKARAAALALILTLLVCAGCKPPTLLPPNDSSVDTAGQSQGK